MSPIFFDQFDNASRLEALGIGQTVEAYGDEDVSARLQLLLTAPEVKRNCARVKSLFEANDGVRDVCAILEGLR